MIRSFWNPMGLGTAHDGLSRVVSRLLVGLALRTISRDSGEAVLQLTAKSPPFSRSIETKTDISACIQMYTYTEYHEWCITN